MPQSTLRKSGGGFAVLGFFADGNVNVAAGNPVTVTGITTAMNLEAVIKIATTAGAVGEVSSVALTDASLGAGTITFTATSFGAADAMIVIWTDPTDA